MFFSHDNKSDGRERREGKAVSSGEGNATEVPESTSPILQSTLGSRFSHWLFVSGCKRPPSCYTAHIYKGVKTVKRNITFSIHSMNCYLLTALGFTGGQVWHSFNRIKVLGIKHAENLILVWQITVSIIFTQKFRRHTHAQTHTQMVNVLIIFTQVSHLPFDCLYGYFQLTIRDRTTFCQGFIFKAKTSFEKDYLFFLFIYSLWRL